MAREKPRWEPEIDEGPHGTHPKNRDQLVSENRQRAEAHGREEPRPPSDTTTPGGSDAAPAGHAAPKPAPGGSLHHAQPVRTYLVPGEAEGDVRAGPGDAGASDSPERSTVPAGRSRASGASTMLWVGLAVAVVLVILLAWVF
jgi:cobalamin biosynthesis Mg chelatase CobN